MRILGPNSLCSPLAGLNASFSPVPIRKGKLAFISQSAAVSNTILDWAQQREMGFSYFIALGDSLDIDVDELLDFLARDSKTSAILLYLEHLSDARRFVSASRSASRNKPILVIKSGRSPAAASAAVAFRHGSRLGRRHSARGFAAGTGYARAFSAVETLSHMRPLRGEKLMIVSNAAPAALALDELWRRFGKLATLSEETLQRLKDALPTSVTPGNPLDLRDDASSDRYIRAISILLDSQDFDALMIIHSPARSRRAAKARARSLMPCATIRAANMSPCSPTGAVSFLRRRRDAVQRSRAANLPHAGRHHHRVYAYGGISPQPETAARDAGVARESDGEYRRRSPAVAAGD
jgi:acetyltransferase